MPAALSRHAFSDLSETLDRMDAAGQKEIAGLFDRLFEQLKQTDALAATAMQHARDAERELADARAELAGLRAEVEGLEESRERATLFAPEEPADFEVPEPVYHTHEWSA